MKIKKYLLFCDSKNMVNRSLHFRFSGETESQMNIFIYIYIYVYTHKLKQED